MWCIFRNLGNEMMASLEVIIDQRARQWLTTALPSTGLPPHCWLTMDKATPAQVTNQATMIVARHNGIPVAFPVGAPAVYTQQGDSSAEHNAEQMISTITSAFGEKVLCQIVGEF